ncbi:DNA repair and recombination protein RAD54B [Lampetra fluviatilis]
MRRSAAPSVKRARFTPPAAAAHHPAAAAASAAPQPKWLDMCPKMPQGTADMVVKSPEPPNSQATTMPDPPDLSDKTLLSNQQGDVEADLIKRPEAARTFLVPRKHIYNSLTPKLPAAMKVQRSDEQNDHTAENNPLKDNGGCSATKYYSVMWGKASKKKHKKWEGDAVLITSGRLVNLKDMEGKDICKGTGYNKRELESLSEGHTLVISGKEIEVMGLISCEDYANGRCFQVSGASCDSAASTATPNKAARPYASPFRAVTGAAEKSRVTETKVYKPRFNPFAPNALVMPQPSPAHQWQNNAAGLPMGDVVVDPHLVMHLRPHQREGVVFLYEAVMGMRSPAVQGAILADEMGLGKTLQCIALVWTLLRQGPYGNRPSLHKVLIVTPGSLVRNWSREFNKWLGVERIRVFTVDQEHKVEEFMKSPIYPVLIISYEMVLRCIDAVRVIPFGLVICDEGHRLKNSSIKTASAIDSLPCKRRILLTGTPIQNDLQEFYSIVEFVNPGILGSAAAFRKVFEEPIVQSHQPSASLEDKQLGETRAAELQRLTGLFVLRRTQEINERYLPPKREFVVMCRPTPLQIQLYRRLLASPAVRSCLNRVTTDRSPHLVCISALKKLCNDPCLLYKTLQKAEALRKGQKKQDSEEESDVSLYDGLYEEFSLIYNPESTSKLESGKLRVLARLLEAMHQKTPVERVVLVSNSTQMLDVLARCCSSWGYSWARLDGTTPVSQRQHLLENFNSRFSTHSVFLLSSKAGGVGLNLVGASRLVLYDIDWNPANDIQAMARVWRDGQHKTVHIYRFLTTGTIEEKIYQRQVSKQGLSGSVVDAASSARSEHIRFSLEELRNLFTLHEGTCCFTHDLLGCPCQEDGGILSGANKDSLVERTCQLGRARNSSSSAQHSTKALSMAELMEWHHLSSTGLSSLPDPDLYQAADDITFVMHNETKLCSETTALTDSVP